MPSAIILQIKFCYAYRNLNNRAVESVDHETYEITFRLLPEIYFRFRGINIQALFDVRVEMNNVENTRIDVLSCTCLFIPCGILNAINTIDAAQQALQSNLAQMRI